MNQRLVNVLGSILISMILVLLAFSGCGESSLWDCSECGKTGNTGNYCGGCAHPAPWLETSKVETRKIIMHKTHDAYIAAENDSAVSIETYVQATQSWWNNMIVVYAQSPDGAYFIYNMECSEEDSSKLKPGTPIRVNGYKSTWSGEIEIVDATFEFIDAEPYIATPTDVTDLLGKDELINHQNELVVFKGMTVVAQNDGAAVIYKNAEKKTDDLYYTVSKNGVNFEFCVEFYLCDQGTEVYKTVENLQIGDTIDIEAYLYWYNGPIPHSIKVTKSKESSSTGAKGTWDCQKCGKKGNTGEYCGQCGHPAPWNDTETKDDSSSDAKGTWDCQECGKKGNTGNYCGECAHPAPWIDKASTSPLSTTEELPTFTPTSKPTNTPSPSPQPILTPTPIPDIPLKILQVKYVGEGLIQIDWTGSDNGLIVSAYCYRNENKNDSINNINLISWQENVTYARMGSGSGSGIFGWLVPGQRYWINLTNQSGVSDWYDYTIPNPIDDLSQTGISASLSGVSFGYTDSNGKWKNGGIPTRERIEKQCYSSPLYDDTDEYLYLRFDVNFRKIDEIKKHDYYVYLSMILPNGDPYFGVSLGGLFGMANKGDWYFWQGLDWDELYRRYGEIPIGTYTVICGFGKEYGDVGDYLIGTKSFEITP